DLWRKPDEKTKIFFLCWILDVDQDRELCVLQPGTVPEAGLRVQKLIVCGHLLPKECFVCYLFSRTLLSLQRHPFLRNRKKRGCCGFSFTCSLFFNSQTQTLKECPPVSSKGDELNNHCICTSC
uniref:Uncharacterized protein n=1 Tax=Oryzias sinensis TaxID=183150 RepID=A0A8C8DIB9_9TELE